MFTLVDLISRSLFDNINTKLSPTELENEWQKVRNDSKVVEEASQWLAALEENSPQAAAILKQGWIDPKI